MTADPAMHDGCPDPNDLAAFLDGRLRGDERTRIVAHLVRCRRCFAVIEGVIDFQEQEEAAGGAPVRTFAGRSFRGGKAPRWVWPLAAALVVALCAGLAVAWRWLPGPTDSGELVAALEAGPVGLAGQLYQAVTLRSVAGLDLELAQADFQLGVFLVDLRVALEAGDAEAARERLGRIAATMGGMVFIDEAWGEFYEQAREEIGTERTPADLLEPAAALEAEIDRDIPGPHLPLGKWTEAARLAAVTGDAEYLESRRTRRRLARLLGQEEAFVDEELLSELRAVGDTLAAGGLRPDDLEALAKRLDAVIDAQAR